jgi:hypothetical protein
MVYTKYLFLVLLKLTFHYPPHPLPTVRNIGFLGFWLLLGRVQSMERPPDHQFHCFSSGCLAATCALYNISVDDTLNKSLDLQRQWNDDQISRYQVVEHFVKFLVDAAHKNQAMVGRAQVPHYRHQHHSNVTSSLSNCSTDNRHQRTHSRHDNNLLQNLHIYTVTKDKGGHVTTPKTMQHLESLLRATIWIPYITGDSLWFHDEHTGLHHVDGGFGTSLWPDFSKASIKTLSTPLQFTTDIMWNLFNLNVSRQQAQEYWSKGFAFGI